MKRCAVLGLVCLVFCPVMNTTWGGAVSTEELYPAIEVVYPALIRLDVVQVRSHGGHMQKRRVFGSGAMISESGYVITNHHVAGGATRIVCRLVDGRQCHAILIGTDALSDIAVVQLDLAELKGKDIPVPAKFGDSDQLRVGDTVFAMGSPAALSQSVTQGIVSNTAMILPQAFSSNRRFDVDGEPVGSLVRWIGHDAIIFGGNSGGPLVDAKGQIIGINEMGVGSLGGAIPGNLARSVADQLIQGGEVKRSWIGLVVQPRLSQAGRRGVLVGSVQEGSPADKAGIQPGDLILRYDGVEVDCAIEDDLPVFNALVLGTVVGKTVDVLFSREKKLTTSQLTTRARGRKQSSGREIKEWGVAVRDLTFLSAIARRQEDQEGVQIDTVAAGGPGGQAKPPLQRYDVLLEVNGWPVPDVDTLRVVTADILKEKTAPVSVAALVSRKGQQVLCVVEIGLPPDPRSARFAKKAWMPVETQVVTRELVKVLNLPIKKGVRITQVFAGHSAEKAGLEVGDILLAVDGMPIEALDVKDTEVFPAMIRQYRAGTEVVVKVLRDGKQSTVKVVLETRPKQIAELPRYVDNFFEFSLRGLAFDDRKALQLKEDIQGVLVESVQAAGWAALASLKPRDVILTIDGEAVTSIDEAKRVLNRLIAEKQGEVVFFIQREQDTRFVKVEASWD